MENRTNRRAREMAIALSAALLCAPLSAGDLPEIKVGLWSIDSSAGGADTPRSVLVCMNTDVVQELMKGDARVLPAGKCKSAIDENGSSYVETTDCIVRGRELQVKSVATFAGNEKFHIDSERTGPTTDTMLIDGKYLSACPAATQVGDVMAPNGQKTNVLREANAGRGVGPATAAASGSGGP
jgi:hypothetical protein